MKALKLDREEKELLEELERDEKVSGGCEENLKKRQAS